MARTSRSIIVMVSLSLVCSTAAAQCLTFESNSLIGAAGQSVGTGAEIQKLPPGVYWFDFTHAGTMSIPQPNLGLANAGAKVKFSYGPMTDKMFRIGGTLPQCTAGQQDVFTIKIWNATGPLACTATATFHCAQTVPVLRFGPNLGGSGTLDDPVRFCGTTAPVRLNASQSKNASTYRVGISEVGGTGEIGRDLTFAEMSSFDLRTMVPKGYFKATAKYNVKLTTGPALASETKVITFPAAANSWSMKDSTGKVFVAAPDASVGPIVVCPGNVVMDTSATTCESAYFVAVQESDVSWNRPMKHEWGWWTQGDAGNSVNVENLIAAEPRGFTPPQPPFRLAGGDLEPGKPRYYRITLAVGDPSWNAKNILIRMGNVRQCSGYDRGVVGEPCPRKEAAWAEIDTVIRDLFLSSCRPQAAYCPYVGVSEEAMYPLHEPKPYSAWNVQSSTEPVFSVALQDQIVANIRKTAAGIKPVCSSGGEKVPVDLKVHKYAGQGSWSIAVNITYGCCAPPRLF